jgi:hypothetical protein
MELSVRNTQTNPKIVNRREILLLSFVISHKDFGNGKFIFNFDQDVSSKFWFMTCIYIYLWGSQNHLG